MKLLVTKGATSKSVDVFIRDSSVTTGAGLTGLAYNTASLTAYYRRPGAAATAITLATLANAQAAYSSGGFVAVDGTNMPGVYRLDIPNAALASGVDQVVIMLKGAANMEPVVLEIQLTDYTEWADALLKRDMSAITGEAARSPLNALRLLRNKVDIAAGTLTVTKEDDSTSAWTAAVTTTAGANPITAVDPA